MAAVIAVSGLLGGCLVRHHGHVAWIVPPLVAAAVVTSTADRVWVDGHWDWVDGRWAWSEGMWIDGRAGFVWEQGVWMQVGPRYHYRPGHWRPAPRYEVRDHRR